MSLAPLGASTTPLAYAGSAGSASSYTAAALNQMSASQIQTLGVSTLTTNVIKGLSSALQNMSALQIGGVIAAGESVMSAAQFARLAAGEIDAMTTTEISALTPSQASGLSTSSIANMSAAQIQAFSAKTLEALSGAQWAAFSQSEIGELTTSEVAGLAASAIARLSASDIAALTTNQVQALSATELNAMSKTEIAALAVGDLTTTEIKGLTSALTDMSATQFGSLDASEIGALSATQLKSLAAADFAKATATEIAAIQPSGLPALSAADVGGLSSGAVAALGGNFAKLSNTALGSLTATEGAALTAAEIGALGATGLAAISATALGALSATAAAAISTTAIAQLSTSALAKLPASLLGDLGSTQVQALSTTQLNALSTTAFDAIDVADFDAAQVSALRATALQTMSVSEFDSLVAPHVAALSVTAISGLTTTEIASLTSTEAANFTAKQIAAMSAADKAALATASSSVMQDVAAQEQDGAISYSGVLQVLEEQATGGMTASKFSGLQTFDSEVDSGKIKTSAYVQQILDDVVSGNSANAYWNGGANTAVALGDLSATSSQAEVDELIGKWFLGTDLPATNVTSVGGANVTNSYQDESLLPLFGANGPQYTDVNQGNTGDCYFVSALAETAKNDPSLIENMIQSNGNGSYSVLFHVDGEDDYVTVNSELPVMSGREYADGSSLEFANGSTLWAPLVEKAYAELMEQTSVQPGMSLNQHGDSYADIAGGDGDGITAITGQSTTYQIDDSASTAARAAQTIESAIANGEDVMMGSSNLSSGNVVSSHMYQVIGFDAATDTVTLQNPWNQSYSGPLKMQFTETLQQLASLDVSFFAAEGKAAKA